MPEHTCPRRLLRAAHRSPKRRRVLFGAPACLRKEVAVMDTVATLLMNIPSLMLVVGLLGLLVMLVYAPLIYLAVLREQPNRRLIRLIRAWRSGLTKERKGRKRRRR